MKASRLAVVGAIAASAVVVLSSPAFAHVTVQPEGTAAKGGYATVNFQVPNERDNASTTKLVINFPTDHPLASVMPEQVDGWKIVPTKTKLDKPVEVHGRQISEAITKVTWTAEDKGIGAGFAQRFPVVLGPLPEDADELVFKAIQTYSNGEVVRWIEEQQEGQEEPEDPAPVLELAAASEDGHHDSSATEETSDKAAADTENASAETAAPADSSDTTARVLAVVGIVVGVLGVAYGVLAGRRRTTA